MNYNAYIADAISKMVIPGASYLNKKTIASCKWNQMKGNPIPDTQKYMDTCYKIFCNEYTIDQVLRMVGPYETVSMYRTVYKWKQEEELPSQIKEILKQIRNA